jgi:PAS domain S-box-containing protein
VRRRTLDFLEVKERFEYLSKASTEAIFFTKNGIGLTANQAAADMFGYNDSSEFIGMFGTEIIAPESHEIVKEHIVKNLSDPYEAVGKRKDGTYFPIAIQARRMAYKDKGLVHVTSIIDISRRKHAEAALRESQDELKSIFRAAPIGLGVVYDRVLHQVNEHLCSMVGYSKDELTEQDARILYPENEDYEYVGREKYRQIKKYGTGTVETRFKHKDGKIIDILMSSTPLDLTNISAGVTFTALDISQQKQNERDTQTLVESTVGKIGQELFDSIVFKLCDWLQCNCAIIGEITRENKIKVVSMILDDAPVENYLYALKGSPCDETIRQDYCVYPENVADLFPHDTFLMEMDAKGYVGAVLEDRNGQAAGILCAISRNKIQTNEHTQNIMKIIATRVSAEIERKRLEKVKDKLEMQLQQAHKMESIGTLAGGIAHDFNNILFPIIGHSEMILADVNEKSPFRSGLNQIYTSALRARDLVKQILTFSRQEQGELKLMKMQPVIEEASKLIRSTISTSIEIKMDIQPDCGVIKADPTQIHQIIVNLATNAYHAMEKKGGELKMSLKEVEVGEPDLFNPDIEPVTNACLSITDTGKGMDSELMQKIFDPFFTTKVKGKGTGLGLSVVHGIVQSMNGDIKVFSKPGKGSEFHVYLPLAEEINEQQPSVPVEESIVLGSGHILLVDDEDIIIEMEQNILERLGYEVTACSSSIDALEIFCKAPDKFDMVITDMAMPNMSGDELSTQINQIRPGTPILLCTGFSETMSEEKAASFGINGFLLKPIVIKDLSHKIREVLDQNKL